MDNLNSTFFKNLTQFTLHQSPSLIAYHEPTGKYLYANQGYKKLLGYEPHDLVGKSLYDFIHPDDIQTVQNQAHQVALESTENTVIEYRFKSKSGEYHCLRTTTIPILERSTLIKLITYSQNITREHALREQLTMSKNLIREISGVAALGRWEYNLKTQEYQWSDKLYEILEIPIGKKMSVDESINMYEPEFRPLMSESFEKLAVNGVSVDVQAAVRTGTGRRKWVRVIGKPQIQAGKVIKMYGVYQDVTAAVEEQNSQIGDMMTYLNRQNERLREFSQIISHDLRGPLSSLAMLTNELGENGQLDPETARGHLSHNIHGLMNKVKLMSEVLDKPQEVRGECVNLDQAIKNVIRSNQGLLLEKNLEIQKGFRDFDEIYYSPFKMNSILQNIISNSALYSDPDKDKRILKIDAIIENDRHKLVFTDNGLGMDISANHKFKLGQKFHHNLSRSGQGLFSIQALVEMDKGEMITNSKTGEGTTIEITLDKFRTNT